MSAACRYFVTHDSAPVTMYTSSEEAHAAFGELEARAFPKLFSWREGKLRRFYPGRGWFDSADFVEQTPKKVLEACEAYP